MVQTDTPPSTPLNLSEMMGDEYDLDELDDIEEITFDDLEQLSDDSQNSIDGSNEDDQDMNRVDDSVLTIEEHAGPVFCCHVDPVDGVLAITGGEDEKIYLWNTDNGEVIFEGVGFKDSVAAVEFNYNGKLVAAGDMGGVVKVWKISPPNPPQEVWTDNVDEVTWMKWHHKTNVLLCGVFSGEVFMWKIPSGECKILAGHGVSCDIGQFMPDGKRAVIGYKDGLVKVYDLNSCNVTSTLENSELDSILCLASHSDNNLIAAGTINNKVALFSTQTAKLISLLTCVEDREGDDFRESVESVAFSKEPSLPLLAVGTISTVVIWDFTKQVIRHRYSVIDGVTKLMWDLQGPLIYIGTQDGEVKVMDARSATIESSFRGHTSGTAILDMAFSKDGKKLITASDDKTAKVFSLGPVL